MAKAKKTATKSPAAKPAATSSTKVTADEHLIPYARKQKVFSTGSVARDFNISSGSATALVAILRIKRAIEKDGKASDGTSQWRWVG